MDISNSLTPPISLFNTLYANLDPDEKDCSLHDIY